MLSSVMQHPDVPNNLHLLSDRPLKETAALYPFAQLYEAGRVLVLPSHRLVLSDEEWKLLAEIEPKPGAEMWVKKAKVKAIMAPLTGEKPYPAHVLYHLLGPDITKAHRMQRIVESVQNQLEVYVRLMFPTYRITGTSHSWRFTVSESEAMHYDSYGTNTSEDHYVRLFVNLDDKPRLWGLTYPVDDCIRIHREVCRPHVRLHPNLFNAALNEHLPWKGMPRHFVGFAPGAMWLVNSQIHAHEAIYGRKLIACTYNVDPSSMLSPERSFPNVVRAALAQHLGA